MIFRGSVGTHRNRRVMMTTMIRGSLRMSWFQFSVHITSSRSRCDISTFSSCCCSCCCCGAVSVPAASTVSWDGGGAADTWAALAACTGGSGGPPTLAVCRYLISGCSACFAWDDDVISDVTDRVAVTDSCVCQHVIVSHWFSQNFATRRSFISNRNIMLSEFFKVPPKRN